MSPLKRPWAARCRRFQAHKLSWREEALERAAVSACGELGLACSLRFEPLWIAHRLQMTGLCNTSRLERSDYNLCV